MPEFENLSRKLGNKFTILACIKKTEATGVYVAKNKKGEKVLLKVLSNKLVDAETLNRFKREARILAKLDHPNIVKVNEWNFGEECSFISFEYFESDNLRKIIRENNLSEEQKIKIVADILTGIDYLHKNGVIHRDLKPDNILVDKNLQLKITDFGLSFLNDDEFTTRNYSIVGTPGYMAPEQLQGKTATEQTDLFAVGIIVYELFLGKNPFIAGDFNQTLNNVLNFNLEKIKPFREKFPLSIYNLLLILLEPKTEHRARTAEEALKTIGENINAAKTKRKPNAKTLLLFTVLLIFASGMFYFVFRPKEAPHIAKEIERKEVPVKEEKRKENVIVKPENIEKGKSYATETKPPENKVVNSPQKEASQKERLQIEDKKIAVRENEAAEKIAAKKMVTFSSYPWAEISLDGKKLGVTPLEAPVEIAHGEHLLEVKNPFYPALKKKIRIDENTPDKIYVNLVDEFAYLNCTVFPWGDVYLDSVFIAETPFHSPMPVYPGERKLIVKNPNFPVFEKKVNLIKGDTLQINVNFSEINSKN